MSREDVLRAVDEELARRGGRLDDRDDLVWSASKALDVGAAPPLQYIDSGTTADVFCDARVRAYKVAKLGKKGLLHDEAEWLATAAEVPGVREHVAHFIAYHPERGVIERECVREGRPSMSHRSTAALHQDIAELMREHGWGAPEYCEDAYVTSDRGPVLVDAGFAARHGERHLRFLEDVANGSRPSIGRLDTLGAVRQLRLSYPDPSPRIRAIIDGLTARADAPA